VAHRSGLDSTDVRRRLVTAAHRMPDAAGRAMYEELEIEMAEMKAQTPVDTGALRSTGHVEPPVISGREIRVDLGFGGPAAPYAVIVHEDLDAHHPVGNAKYVERPLLESAPFLPERIGRRLNLAAIMGA
jgi:hypothetical protein